MRCESREMTVIPWKFLSLKYFPREVLVPQVFLLPVPVSLSRSLGVVVGVLSEHCTGNRLVRDPRLECPKSIQGWMGLRLHQPDQERISPILMGASHGTVRFPDPISAQPARSRSRENDRIKTACNRTAQPATETDQPRSEPCSTPQKKA